MSSDLTPILHGVPESEVSPKYLQLVIDRLRAGIGVHGVTLDDYRAVATIPGMSAVDYDLYDIDLRLHRVVDADDPREKLRHAIDLARYAYALVHHLGDLCG